MTFKDDWYVVRLDDTEFLMTPACWNDAVDEDEQSLQECNLRRWVLLLSSVFLATDDDAHYLLKRV